MHPHPLLAPITLPLLHAYLLLEALVDLHHGACMLDHGYGVLEGPPPAVHQIGRHQGGGPRPAPRTVHQHRPALRQALHFREKKGRKSGEGKGEEIEGGWDVSRKRRIRVGRTASIKMLAAGTQARIFDASLQRWGKRAAEWVRDWWKWGWKGGARVGVLTCPSARSRGT
jgi:hypothetical protein